MSGTVDSVVTEDQAPAAVELSARYRRLDRVDRQAAETLNNYCRTNRHDGISATKLANLAASQSFITALPLALADFITLYLVVFGTSGVMERLMGISTQQVENQTAFFISLIILPIASLAGLYPGIGHNPIVEFRQIAKSLFACLAVLAGIGWFVFPEHWSFFVASAVIGFFLALPAVVVARYLARHACKHFRWWGVSTFILAEPEHAAELYRRLEDKLEHGFRPVGVLLDPDQYWKREHRFRDDQIPVYDIRQAEEVAIEKGITYAIIATNVGRNAIPALDQSLAVIPNRVLLSSEHFDMGIWDHVYTVGSITGLRLSGGPPNAFKLFCKRFVDLTFSLAALLLGLPIWLLLCLAIRVTSKGPVFYGQRRVGRGGREFTAWKFRTMYSDADQVLEDYLRRHPEAQREWDETHKLADDPRITPIGRLLRSTSMDELPQVWNVIVGEMSLVGPRPIIDSPTYDRCYITDYPHEFEAYKSVRPGLTGLWQVRCRNRGVYELRIFHDMDYIRNYCIWLDLYLIMRTFKTVLFNEGN